MVYIDKLMKMKLPQDGIKLISSDIIGSDLIFLNENKNSKLTKFMSFQKVSSFDNIIVPSNMNFLNKKIINTKYIKEVREKLPKVTKDLKRSKIPRNHNIFDLTPLNEIIISRLHTGAKNRTGEFLFRMIEGISNDFNNNKNSRGIVDGNTRGKYLFIYNNMDTVAEDNELNMLNLIQNHFRKNSFKLENPNFNGIIYCINNRYFPLTFIDKDFMFFNQTMFPKIDAYINSLNKESIEDQITYTIDESKELITELLKTPDASSKDEAIKKAFVQKVKDIILNTNDMNLKELDFNEKIKYIFKENDKEEHTVEAKTTKEHEDQIKQIKGIAKIKKTDKDDLALFHGASEVSIKSNSNNGVFDDQAIVGLDMISSTKRQKTELTKTIDTKMLDLFQTMADDKDINLTIKDIKIDLVDEHNNRYKRYRVKVQHDFGNTMAKPYTLEFKVPYPIEDKYIKINGNNYIMINQLFPKPLQKINENLVRLFTHFNTASFTLKSSALDKGEINQLEENTLLNLENMEILDTELFDSEDRKAIIIEYSLHAASFSRFKYKKIEVNHNSDKFKLEFNLKDNTIYTHYVGDKLMEKSYIKDMTIYTETSSNYDDMTTEISEYGVEYLDQYIFDKLNDISTKVLNKDLYKKSKTSAPTFTMNLPGIKNKSILMYLCFIKGIKKAMNDIGIKYTIVPRDKKDKDAYLSIPFKDMYMNLYPNTNLEKFMVNGLKDLKMKSYNYSNDIVTKFYERDLGYRANKYRELSTKFIDNSSKKALREDNYPDNLLDLIQDTIPNMLMNRQKKDSNHLDNYRLRMSETVANVAYQVVQMAVTNFKNKKHLHNAQIDIDKNYIFANLISASILQETISINPLEELMLASKTTKAGVGNAKKGMITLERRDLNETYFGVLSPVSTNEYGGIGINQTLTNSFQLADKEGGISKKAFNNESNPFENLSIVESLSPFFEYDDTTRRIMGNQQTGQFVQIENPDEPLIQTGFESYIPELVSDRFAKKSKGDGKVISILDNVITVAYKDGKNETFNCTTIKSRTKRGIYIPTNYNILVGKNQKIKKGDILASTNSLKTGKLAIGKNVNLALIPYMGMNFEDGWVVSSNMDKMFKHKILKRILIPIPPNATINKFNLDKTASGDKDGITTQPGDILIDYNTDNTLDNMYDSLDEEADVFTGLVTDGKTRTYSSPGGVIKEVVVLLNDNKTTPKAVKSLHTKLTQPIKDKLDECKLYNHTKEDVFECNGNIESVNSLKIGNHKFEGSEYDGSIIEIYIEIDNPIINGTKFTLANTGGKGTVQYKIPAGKEPISKDTNMTIDFVPTSIGIIKRKNISIILMLYLGKVMFFLNETIKELAKDEKNYNLIKSTILKVYTHIDRTKDNKLINQLNQIFKNKDGLLSLIRKSDSRQRPAIPAIVPPFSNKLTVSNIEDAAKELGIPLNEKVWIPELEMWTETEVPVGILPIFMLEHFPKAMSSVRGSLFNKKEFMSGQGRSGTKEGAGANKVGFYDMHSLLTKSPYNLIKELHAVRSDAPKAKNALMKAIIKNDSNQLPSIKDIELDEAKDGMSKRYSEILFKGAGLMPHF